MTTKDLTKYFESDLFTQYNAVNWEDNGEQEIEVFLGEPGETTLFVTVNVTVRNREFILETPQIEIEKITGWEVGEIQKEVWKEIEKFIIDKICRLYV